MNIHVEHYSYAAKWVAIKLRIKWKQNKKCKKSRTSYFKKIFYLGIAYLIVYHMFSTFNGVLRPFWED